MAATNIKIPVVANIRQFSVAGKVAQLLVMTDRIETAAAYDQKIRTITNGKLEIIPGTVRNVTGKNHFKAIACHVRPVTESLPYEEAASTMRTVVEANVFADNEDNVWGVVEANGVKRLVKRTEVDIDAILQAATNVSHSRVSAHTYEYAGARNLRNGNFVVFANDDGELDSGVAVYSDDGSLHVAAIDAGRDVVIDPISIVANAPFSVEAEEGEDVEIAAVTAKPIEATGLKTVMDYYAGLYKEHPEFWASLRDQINRLFSIA